MRLIVEKSVGFDETTVKELRAGSVRGHELYPAFIKISLFGKKVVDDFLVLYNNSHGHGFTGQQGKVLPI